VRRSTIIVRTRSLGSIEVKGRRGPLDAFVLEALGSG
jgi:hypothetical protein